VKYNKQSSPFALSWLKIQQKYHPFLGLCALAVVNMLEVCRSKQGEPKVKPIRELKKISEYLRTFKCLLVTKAFG
jgi:hypothetical protein